MKRSPNARLSSINFKKNHWISKLSIEGVEMHKQLIVQRTFKEKCRFRSKIMVQVSLIQCRDLVDKVYSNPSLQLVIQISNPDTYLQLKPPIQIRIQLYNRRNRFNICSRCSSFNNCSSCRLSRGWRSLASQHRFSRFQCRIIWCNNLWLWDLEQCHF